MESSIQSVGDLPVLASIGNTDTPHSAPNPGVRDGSLTLSQIVDGYMAVYQGRDTSRHHRLAFWVAKLGHLSLLELNDDVVFGTLEELASRRGRFFAGTDADGRPVLKQKAKPLSAATVNSIRPRSRRS